LKWIQISLPEDLVNEVEKELPNLIGFTSKSDFIRNAVRYYLDLKRVPNQQILAKEVIASG
jgi:metal-responsive CopG/Arc/MetJ family transcriptional regulator